MSEEKYSIKPDHFTPKKSYNLNKIVFRRFTRILKSLFTKKSSNTILLTLLLLVLCIGQQFIIYYIGMIPSNFFKILGEKNETGFTPLLIRAFVLILLISLCNSTIKLTSGHLYVMWREKLTNLIQRKYFSSSTVLYSVNVAQHEIDNVDQRIGQDVERFCAQLRDLIPKLLISPLTIVYYSVQCFNATGYIGPVVIYGYFLMGTILNRIIMATIVNLVFKQEKCEGDFRYWHTVIRAFSESISFLKGQTTEHVTATRFFHKLVAVQRRMINREMFLDFSTNLFDYIGSILSYIVISVSIFAGKYDNLKPVALSSLISKNAFVSMYLISCFSTLIDMSGSFTDLFAFSHRIGELIEYLDFCLCSANDKDIDIERTNDLVDNVLLSVNELTFSAPNSSEHLVTKLSLTVKTNKNVLIVGKTGCGKSSLLRVLLGLWPPSDGKIDLRIPQKQLLFLPQKAFLTKGSLIDQVIYPLIKDSTIDLKEVGEILNEVGLQILIKRIGGIDTEPSWNWYDGLSPGEIQRLSFARLCYQKPKLVVLDEPTSSLGCEEEKLLYQACSRREITVITVGHRESLKQFHHTCLELEKQDGKWKCYDL